MPLLGNLRLLCIRARSRIAQRDFGVGGDDVGDLRDAGGHRSVKSCAGAGKATFCGRMSPTLASGRIAFEAVTDLRPIVVILDGDEHENAAV